MARIVCARCESTFDSEKNTAPWFMFSLIGAAIGYAAGAMVGIAGSFGGVSGAIPFALIGAFVTGLMFSKMKKCPECGKVQSV